MISFAGNTSARSGRLPEWSGRAPRVWQLGALVGALLAAAAWSPCSRLYGQEVGWALYESPDGGFRISYPADWRAIVAVERASTSSAWEPMVLGEGEVSKVTFYELGDSLWPGQYQLRLLANPERLDLEEAYEGFDLSDLWDESAADTVLGGVSAKTWVRWNFDSLLREFLAVVPRGLLHVRYDDHNSNDPSFKAHRRTYDAMTESLALSMGVRLSGRSVPRR